jgi:hypothetical protein
MSNTATDYEGNAQRFLDRFKIRFQATWRDTECPIWEDGEHIHGDRYRITLKKDFEDRRTGSGHVAFDFWNSANDRAKGLAPSPYSVLACLSSDVHTPETFEDFCSEYGYDEDSRKAFHTFKAANRLAVRLRAFFSEAEIEALSEIS